MDSHAGDKHYQVLFYWRQDNIKNSMLFTTYEKARDYVLQQEFDSLTKPDVIEINEW